MITIRQGKERGIASLDWLKSKHTFSFGNYYDSNYMGFRSLRVINEDRVQPGKGFGTHSHRDMEIISYVLSGVLEHKDNIGNGSIIHAGEVQKMSAGKGIFHSEYNPSSTQPVHFLQIWIMPNQLGIEPSYEQRMWTEIEKKGKFKLIGSPDGKDDSITIHQDVYLYITALDKEQEVSYKIAPQRRIWLQIVKVAIKLHDYSLVAGDGAAITLVDSITLKATDDQSEILLFDMN